MTARAPVAAARGREWQPHIVAFVCRWCSYAGADMAGTTRLHYPASVRLLRFPCTGRMSPLFIVKALERGADGVLVSGCHPGDCHYVHGNLVARRRFTVFRSLMEFLGLDPRRLHFAWVSAAEGMKWARVIEKVTDAVRAAGPMETWAEVTGGVPVSSPSPAEEAHEREFPTPADQEAVAQHVQDHASDLLSEGRVSLVLGFRQGSLPGQVVPALVTRPEEASSLVWSPHCFSNLCAYLPGVLERFPKVAVVVKCCDAKAVVGLLQEGQIRREDVVLVGVSCPGVSPGDSLASKCHSCTGEVPELCDIAVEVEGTAVATGEDPRDAQVAWLESLSHAERWAYWQAQFDRCLRCYGCRAVCPLCYCDTCIAHKHRPQWIPTTIDGPGNTAWNVVRALHLAGRCVGCDECARVCPANIRLDLLNRKLALEVERNFGYLSGEDPEASPVMADFRMDDPGEFIL